MFQFSDDHIDFAHKLDFASSIDDQYYKHMHHFYEMLYFIDGSCDYVVGQQTKKLKRGDLVFIKPGELHFASVDRKEPYERYVLKFKEGILPAFLMQRLEKFRSFYAFSKENLFSGMEDIVSSYDKEEAGALLTSSLQEILIRLSRDERRQTVHKDPWAEKALAYIEKHIKEKMTLDSIAGDLGLSTSYLSALFLKSMKVPVMQYVRSKKVIEARREIVNGKKPTEVAEEYGFADYSTFYRSYRQFIGDAPSQGK